MVISEHLESSLILVKSEIDKQGKKCRVFFGSSFPNDKKDERLFSIISSIVDCVENGIICILIDLLEIY